MSDERTHSEPGAPQYGAPEFRDPADPSAHPGAFVQGSMHEQYPGYTGPSPYPPAPITQSNGPGGLAIAALVVGIAAFIFGWIPFAGLILAVVGIVLGILTPRKPRGKGFGVTGLILSGLAVLTGLMVLFLIFMWLPMASFS
jgi:hypothetical protein